MMIANQGSIPARLSRTRLAASALLAILVTGCASTRHRSPDRDIPAGFPNHTPDQIQELLVRDLDQLQSYQAVSNIAIASRYGSDRFTAEIEHRRSDSMRIEIRAALGIEAARILFTPDSVYAYDRIKKTLYYGDINSAGRLLPTPWLTTDLFLDVLGLPEIEIDSDWTVEADSSLYYLRQARTSETVYVDPSVWRIIRYEKRDVEGRLVDQRSFLDLSVFDGTVLPRRIVVRRPLDRISATIIHRSIRLNPELLDLKLIVSDDADYVRID